MILRIILSMGDNFRKHPQPPQNPPSDNAVFAAIAAAAKAGAAFRLSGNRVDIRGLEKVEQADPAIAAFLRENANSRLARQESQSSACASRSMPMPRNSIAAATGSESRCRR